MPVAPDITVLAQKVAEQQRTSNDTSKAALFNRIRAVVRGAGIRNVDQQKRYFAAVQKKLSEFSANARRSSAATKKAKGAVL